MSKIIQIGETVSQVIAINDGDVVFGDTM